MTTQDVGSQLTFGLLCPEGDERGAALSDFFYFTGTNITAQQRMDGSQYSKALAKLVAHAGMQLSRADMADEAAVLVAGTFAEMQVPTMFCISTQPGPARTVELGLLARARGSLDPASIKGRLVQAVRGGDLPLLADVLDGVVAGSEMSTLILEISALLSIPQSQLTDALLFRIERELKETGCTAAGKDASSRVAALSTFMRSRASSIAMAPRSEAAPQDGKTETVPSHSKAQVNALYHIYESQNFQQQEQALMRMNAASGVLFLALTGQFLSTRVGNACGPIDDKELEQSTGKNSEGVTTGPGWFPIPIFHQVVWGQVEALQGKVELNKLAAMRYKMPKLLGVLAARGLRGQDEQGMIRLQTLELTEFYMQLKSRTWFHQLDPINDLWLRLISHYHDEDGAKQRRLHQPDSCGDWTAFQYALEPWSHIMQLVGIPLTGPCSLTHFMAPVQAFWMLHGPAAGPAQRATIEAACCSYIRTSLEDYVTSYNLVRNRADATATFACVNRLGTGNALMTLHQCSAGFNSSIARKRAGGGGGAGEAGAMGTPLKVPRTAWGPETAAGPPKPQPAPQGDGKGKSKGLPPTGDYFTDEGNGVWSAPNGWQFNAAGAQAWLQSNGHSDKCLHAMLLSGAPKQAFKVQVAKACKRVGKPHQEGGAAHEPPAAWKPADFVVRRGGKAGH